MENLDKEPLNIMGDWYQVERKPTLKPPVVEVLIFFQKKTQMFQINGDLDLEILRVDLKGKEGHNKQQDNKNKAHTSLLALRFSLSLISLNSGLLQRQCIRVE